METNTAPKLPNRPLEIVRKGAASILIVAVLIGGGNVIYDEVKPGKPDRIVVNTVADPALNDCICVDLKEHAVYPTNGVSDLDSFKTDKILLKYVEGGSSFNMGSPSNEVGRYSQTVPGLDFEPLREASIPSAFYMSVFEITQKQYELVTGEPHGNKFVQPDRAKDFVSKKDAEMFCDELNKILPVDLHLEASLPSEAEWEYVCRAGTTSPFCDPAITNITDRVAEGLEKYASYLNGADSAEKTMNDPKRFPPVGAFLPNNWGFYDMHGGVWEWTKDEWRPWLNGKPQENLENEPLYSVRGGGYWFNADDCRSANRHGYVETHRNHGFGFRIVLRKYRAE